MSRVLDYDALRTGIIGCGDIRRTYLDANRANGVVLVARAVGSRRALNAAIAEYGGCRVSSFGKLIRSGIVEAGAGDTPPASQHEIAIAALNAGVAVPREKRMATNVSADRAPPDRAASS